MARMCISSHSKFGKMKPQRVFRFLLLCNILDMVYRVVQAVDGHTQAFIQMDGELRYLVDGVSIQMQEPLSSEGTTTVSFTDLEEENLNTYASPIIFDPPSLDFRLHPVGMPHMERVVVQNLSPDTSIHMLSISGSTLHFHCSFFQEKVIPPGGNTTFDVVFLARQEGSVENTLFIHTSLGSFKYQVVAIGSLNPYRLRPFLGVRMPLNSSYSPLIHMHNPYSSTLQLTEMYSSGGDLHLELPTGDSEAPKHLWEIPPYETKPVMRANFVARIERNHTAYIRIKTNTSNQDYLVLPLEVEVTSIPGIYSPTEVLDFGVLRSQDEPKTLSLSLLNSGQKHIYIANVIVTPVSEAVEVKFTPLKVPPDTVWSTQIATVTFIPSKAVHPKQCYGKIVVKSKNNQFKLTIPYHVTLLKGSLDYNTSTTRFYVGHDLRINKTQIRELNITNNFNFTVVIHAISLPEEARPHFTVNFTQPVVLYPGKTLHAAWLTLHPADKSLQLTTYLRLHTNISYFNIPLLCFSGKLKVFLPYTVNQSLIDFGTLGMGDKRTMIFAVINENPVDVNLKHWGSSMAKTYVVLVGIDKGNASTLAWRHNFSGMAKSLILKPHHYAIFRIGVTAPNYEKLFLGEAFLETQYEKIKIPFSMRTAKGSLNVDDIFFENAFPGKISSQNLNVYSTFSHSMTVTSITPAPEDSRFQFDFGKNSLPALHPNTRNSIGKVLFDPRRECKNKCYSGLPTTTSMGHQWLLGMSLPPDVGDMDSELYKSLRSRWQNLIDHGEKNMNITLQLDTSEVKGYLLKAYTSLQWPRLSNKVHLRFPVSQIGNLTIKDFALENPSSLPVLVQVVPLALYPSPQSALEMLSHKLGKEGGTNNIKQLDIIDPDIFTLQDLEEYNSKEDNPIPAYRKSLEEYFGVQTQKQSIAMLLTPGMRLRIQVAFSPKDDILRTSLILIRNNLTVMDALVVQGQGGHGHIKFGNKSPGTDSTLMFELNEKHLKDCDGTQNTKFMQPNFTVRRAFTARNTGELPLYVSGFDINGFPCEGFGFRVLNCQGFELKPNASKKIDIAFTPDFTLSRVERSLRIHSSLGQTLQYTLVATLPRHMLAFCSQALPRPQWEPLLYYCFVSLTAFLILCVLIASYFEGDRILKSTFFALATTTLNVTSDKLDRMEVFDLKALVNSCQSDSNGKQNNNNCENNGKRKRELSFGVSNIVSDSTMLNHSHRRGSGNLSSSRSKDQEDIIDYNIKGNCKKSQRNRHLPEIAQVIHSHEGDDFSKPIKSTSRSWTNFLKPPFSFRSNSSDKNKKPSVATQTSKDTRERNNVKCEDSDNTRELLSNFISSEVEERNKLKQKLNREICKNSDNKSKHKKRDASAEEETSSTTTETSNAESDISEKDNRLPDVCVTSKPMKVRRSKSKSKDNECFSQSNESVNSMSSRMDDDDEEIIDDGGFELSTKSKGHKKIKVDPRKVFGGDILRPSTLELPYKPKPVILPMSKEEKSHSDDMRSLIVKTSKRNTPSKPKGFSSSTSSESGNIDVVKCPSLSVWDYPQTSVDYDEAFSDLVQQTESFAIHHGVTNGNWNSVHQSPLNNLLPSNSNHGRPSTYSSVVSRDTYSSKAKVKNGFQKVNTEGKKPDSSDKLGSLDQHSTLLPSSDLSHSTNSSGNNFLLSSAWSSRIPSSLSLLGSTNAPDISTSGSKLSSWVLHPSSDSPTSTSSIPGKTETTKSSAKGDIKDSFSTSPNISGKSEENDFLSKTDDLKDPCFTGGSLCSSTHLSTWNTPPLTMMQALHAERRKREEDYHKQLALYDWPGFDVSPFPESLWDTNYSPSFDTWNSDPLKSSEDDSKSSIGTKPSLEPPSQIWSNSSKDSSWNTVSTLWQCPSVDSDSGLDLISSLPLDDSEASTVVPQTTSTSPAVGTSKKDTNATSISSEGGFDPFHSTLWTPQLTGSKKLTTSSSADGWPFSLFSNSELEENTKPDETDKKTDEDKAA